MGVYAEFPGMYPDGSLALSSKGEVLQLPEAAAPVASTGLSDIASNIGTPMFSPDGKRVVFNPMGGGSLAIPKQKLVVVDFDRRPLAFLESAHRRRLHGHARGNAPGLARVLSGRQVDRLPPPDARPASTATVSAICERERARWRDIYWNGLSGTETSTAFESAQWVSTKTATLISPRCSAPVTLACTGDGTTVGDIQASHESDVDLNYEPTVNPVAGGGYAWVVFTSRRRYANVATIPPFCSDPRGVDLIANITPKKLWVAAIDLDAKPGKDASHPAFYLPGQELMAGNSRGFWVLDPCRADGDSCATGDQCCNGFCQPDADSGRARVRREAARSTRARACRKSARRASIAATRATAASADSAGPSCRSEARPARRSLARTSARAVRLRADGVHLISSLARHLDRNFPLVAGKARFRLERTVGPRVRECTDRQRRSAADG